MNLGKLLGAGRSFFGGSGVVSYRRDKRVYLPKFNSVKNPFESKPAASPPPVANPPPAVTGAPSPLPSGYRSRLGSKLEPFRSLLRRSRRVAAVGLVGLIRFADRSQWRRRWPSRCRPKCRCKR